MNKTLAAVAASFFAMTVPVMGAESHNLWTTGKIHVVIGVLLIILLLIIVFLFVLERKVGNLEKKIG